MKKKLVKSNTAASVSTNGGRQGRRRESKQKSLADDNRHPDKNSQHTCTNTLLNVFSRQDTRKQHVRLLSLSLSPTNNAMITPSSTRTQLIVTPSLSLAYRHFVKILVYSVELAEKLELYVPSATHHHSFEKVHRRERSWTFLGAPLESRWAGTHSRTTRGGLSGSPLPATSACDAKATPGRRREVGEARYHVVPL